LCAGGQAAAPEKQSQEAPRRRDPANFYPP